MEAESSLFSPKTPPRRLSLDSEDGGAPLPANLAFGYDDDHPDLSTAVDETSKTSPTQQSNSEHQALALVLSTAYCEEKRTGHDVYSEPKGDSVKMENPYDRTNLPKNQLTEHEQYSYQTNNSFQPLYTYPQYDNRSYPHLLGPNHTSPNWLLASEDVLMEPLQPRNGLPTSSWRHVNTQVDQYGRQLPSLPSFTGQHYRWESPTPKQHLQPQFSAHVRWSLNSHQLNQAFVWHRGWHEEMNRRQVWYDNQDSYYTHRQR